MRLPRSRLGLRCRAVVLGMLIVVPCLTQAQDAASPGVRSPSFGRNPDVIPPAVGTANFVPPEGGTASAALALAPQIDLETALQWTLQYNPTLLSTRQNLNVSAEAVNVARHFPTSLNPAVSIQYEPWVFGRGDNGQTGSLDRAVYLTWGQPIELGHRQAYREQMAQAQYTQTSWSVLQTELTAMVQTYRFHQTALYRREKLGIALELRDFNSRLVEIIRRQETANQAMAADVVLAEVESQTTAEQWEAARQDYVSALADLRQQIGIPGVAATAEPTGLFRVPEDQLGGSGEALVQLAQQSRPEVQSAAAAAANSRAALYLARADRIPIPSIGPAYERNETGATFYGINVSTTVPLLNMGNSLVAQRDAEYHRDCVAWEQARQLVAAQVLAVEVKWMQAQQSAQRTHERLEPIRAQTERMERLYDAGQTDLLKLLQVRRRFIESRNVELDAAWQAVQAYADLLAATGGTPLLGRP
jgi:cobalt-zinc-cadmium efflux system outer membrane protein